MGETRSLEPAAALRDDEWSDPGRVIATAIGQVGEGGSITEELLVRVWKDLYKREPDREEKWDLLNYASVLADWVKADSGRRL